MIYDATVVCENSRTGEKEYYMGCSIKAANEKAAERDLIRWAKNGKVKLLYVRGELKVKVEPSEFDKFVVEDVEVDLCSVPHYVIDMARVRMRKAV